MKNEFSEHVLTDFGLARDPIGTTLYLTLYDERLNKSKKFRVVVLKYRITTDYIEITTTLRQIGGKKFNRLLHSLPMGSNPARGWIALAKIPTKDEHDWVATWQVLIFKPQEQ